MNRARIAELADVIEKASPARFNMEKWFRVPEFGVLGFPDNTPIEPKCGTAFCIGGWAILHFNGKTPQEGENVREVAQKILGLTNAQGENLFYGDWSSKDREDITGEEAVAHLRKLAELPKPRKKAAITKK